MQQDEAPDEGYSPLRVARAGRRAGRHVAIAEPDGVSTSSNQEVSSSPIQDGPLHQQARALAQQSSTQQRATAQQDGSASSSAPMQQPELQQQQQQASPEQWQEQQQQPSQPASVQAPPVKRVGFSMDGLGSGAAAEDRREQNFTGVSRRKQGQLQREEQSQAKQRNKYDEKLVDALVDVPELEEEGKEDLTRRVAQAPKASTPQVQAISELELDQAWLPAQPGRNTDINLSLLTSCLLPSAQVFEPPDVWDYNMLFSQLKAELQNEVEHTTNASTSGAHPADDPIPA